MLRASLCLFFFLSCEGSAFDQVRAQARGLCGFETLRNDSFIELKHKGTELLVRELLGPFGNQMVQKAEEVFGLVAHLFNIAYYLHQTGAIAFEAYNRTQEALDQTCYDVNPERIGCDLIKAACVPVLRPLVWILEATVMECVTNNAAWAAVSLIPEDQINKLIVWAAGVAGGEIGSLVSKVAIAGAVPGGVVIHKVLMAVSPQDYAKAAGKALATQFTSLLLPQLGAVRAAARNVIASYVQIPLKWLGFGVLYTPGVQHDFDALFDNHVCPAFPITCSNLGSAAQWWAEWRNRCAVVKLRNVEELLRKSEEARKSAESQLAGLKRKLAEDL